MKILLLRQPLQILPTSTFISEVIYKKFILQRNAQ